MHLASVWADRLYVLWLGRAFDMMDDGWHGATLIYVYHDSLRLQIQTSFHLKHDGAIYCECKILQCDEVVRQLTVLHVIQG